MDLISEHLNIFDQFAPACSMHAGIRQDTRLKEGGTLRANNGERRDRVTLVTEEIRVYGKAEAAESQREENEVVEPHGNE